MADIRRKGKVPSGPGGPTKDAVLIEITKSDEKWSLYDLDDGTQLRFRPTIVEVWRLENEFDVDGNPAYVVKSQNLVTVISPDSLKRK